MSIESPESPQALAQELEDTTREDEAQKVEAIRNDVKLYSVIQLTLIRRLYSKEAEARGAKIIAITNETDSSWKHSIVIDADTAAEFAILSSIAGQLIAYYTADELGRPIDKPRNLAKSVTVK